MEQAKSSTQAAQRLTIDDRSRSANAKRRNGPPSSTALPPITPGKDESLSRHLARLKDVGAASAERKALAETKAKWEAERAGVLESDRPARRNWPPSGQAVREIAALREQAPELESKAASSRTSFLRAGHARGHLNELHDYRRAEPRRPGCHPRPGP